MSSPTPKDKLLAVKQRLGRDICVYETAAASPMPSLVSANEETDDFYELTVEDYYRLLSTKKEDKPLKTRKIREAEQAARRSRFTKSTIKVRFPDNCTLEAIFRPTDTIQSLVDLLKQVVSEPERPFYIYTTPPKKQLKDMSQDFYSAGFIPGAIVYFSYDIPKEDSSTISGPFLDEDILSLKGLILTSEEEPTEATKQPLSATSAPSIPPTRATATDKKPTKPKWLKL